MAHSRENGSELPSGYLEMLQAIPVADILAQRIEQNPDIARWAIAMAQRQAAITLEEAGRTPDPTIAGGFRYFNESKDQAFLFEVAVPLPVFDRHQGDIQEARYQLAKAEEEHRAAVVSVRTVLTASSAELATAFTEASSLRDDVLPGAQLAFDAASEGYRLSTPNEIEIVTTHTQDMDPKAHGTVWVDLRVYPKDLPFVRVGQREVISAAHGIPDVERSIAYVGPVVGEQTRTA